MTVAIVSTSRRRCGFSLTELLVVIVIIVVLASIFVPYFWKIRETDRRVRCEDNLRAIMEGLRQYANMKDSHGRQLHVFPSVIHKKTQSGYTAYTGADSLDPFAKGTQVKPNDVTASLWLLVRNGFVAPGRFICPSTSQSPDPMVSAGNAVSADHRSNFTDGSHLSYSYASPFSRATGYNLSEDRHAADFALMADKNPGISEKASNVTAPGWNSPPFDLAKANSRNHGYVGQNVLYADGHVAWQTTVYCGVGYEGLRDNIYTVRDTVLPQFWGLHEGWCWNAIFPVLNSALPVEAHGRFGREFGPTWSNDSYLVPAEGE